MNAFQTAFESPRPDHWRPKASEGAAWQPGGRLAVVKTIGNVLWLVFSGIWMAIGFAVSGVVCCLTVIGIPFGIQAFKLAGFALWPFGRTVVLSEEGPTVLGTVFNVVWLVLFGWGLFVGALVSAALLCLTVIGIPFAVQSVKVGVLALWPFGRQVVDVNWADRRSPSSV